MKRNYIFLAFLFLVLSNCQRETVTKTHGLSYLEKREKLITVNKTNKNDAIKFLGQPATKGMTDKNLWIYIERTQTKGKFLKLGTNQLTKNNVLVLNFNKYGVLGKKTFFDINDMNKLKFSKDTTEIVYSKKSFIYDFLSSMRQKINDPLGKRKEKRQKNK